jgi:mono/diheme cytochrome c family protein
MGMKTSNIARRLRAALSKALDINLQEHLATWGTIGVFVFVPLWVWWYEGKHIPDRYPEEAKVFILTGVGSEGRWTFEEVTGYNYWWNSFLQATIAVEDGDLVVLRLKSANVTHVFYAPTLGIDPIYIEPGHVQEVTFRAQGEGVHEYYCLAVCGDCHFYMKGKIIVGAENLAELSASQPADFCAHDIPDLQSPKLIERGKFLFKKMGCTTCHGANGKGGVPNPNYVKGTVPPLNTLHKSLSLVDEEAAEELVKLIEEGKNAEEMTEMDTDIPRQRLVFAKYGIVRDVIKQGRPVARADTMSFDPPLTMPSWAQRLSERDIDALIVYLLKHQSWEDDEY